MKNTLLIITAVLAVLLVSCGKSPDSDEVQTHPENDVPTIVTTEAAGEDVETIDDGEPIDIGNPEQTAAVTESGEIPEVSITTAGQTVPTSDTLTFEAVYNPEAGTFGGIEITITNNGEAELSFGADAKAEMLKNGSWEFCWQPEAIDLWCAELLPGKSYSDTVYLDKANALSAGTYRVCREINGADCYSDEFVVE